MYSSTTPSALFTYESNLHSLSPKTSFIVDYLPYVLLPVISLSPATPSPMLLSSHLINYFGICF